MISRAGTKKGGTAKVQTSNRKEGLARRAAQEVLIVDAIRASLACEPEKSGDVGDVGRLLRPGRHERSMQGTAIRLELTVAERTRIRQTRGRAASDVVSLVWLAASKPAASLR
jgi:hypothetical protein